MIDQIIYKLDQYSWSPIKCEIKREVIDDKNYVNKDVLREWAVKTSNNAAYRDYERFEESKKEMAFVRYMCRSYIVFSTVGWLFSGKVNPVFTEIIFNKVKSLPWYLDYPIVFVIACFSLCLFGIAFYDEDKHQDFVHLRNHSIPDPNNC